jgi:hypothetical protein
MTDRIEQVFSPCGRYRYRRNELLETGNGTTATFILFNPATTDDVNYDSKRHATMENCAAMARSWGCSRFVAVNLFAYRAEKPKKMMKEVAEPIGPENDQHVLAAAEEAAASGGKVVCAWGRNGKHRNRDRDVLNLLKGYELFCPLLTKEGFPHHPARLPPSRWKMLPYRGRP